MTNIKKKILTVKTSKFHGREVLYIGKNINEAIKIGRKYQCNECKCEGPTIEREDGIILKGWHKAKPFQLRTWEPYWAD